MISRRILRIKVMQALYAYYKHDGNASINGIEKELFFSINKTYDLYHYLLTLIIDISNYANRRIEISQNKKLPSKEDLNPNTKFIDNKVISQIRVNNRLLHYLESHKLNWVNYPELIKGLYNDLIEHPDYLGYMENSERSYQEDRSFVCKIFMNIIANHEALYNILEEQSIFWNDEVEFVISSIVKTLKKFREPQGEDAELMALFKSKDDEEFAKKLFRKVILNQAEYRELIEKFSKNWDFDRIAFMDILLIEIAIGEAIEFNNIPIKVTFNEYIELSKYYSTKRSNVFINGMLDKIFNHLKQNSTIAKHGRGLIGEV